MLNGVHRARSWRSPPRAGFVAPWAAVVIGLVAGVDRGRRRALRSSGSGSTTRSARSPCTAWRASGGRSRPGSSPCPRSRRTSPPGTRRPLLHGQLPPARRAGARPRRGRRVHVQPVLRRALGAERDCGASAWRQHVETAGLDVAEHGMWGYPEFYIPFHRRVRTESHAHLIDHGSSARAGSRRRSGRRSRKPQASALPGAFAAVCRVSFLLPRGSAPTPALSLVARCGSVARLLDVLDARPQKSRISVQELTAVVPDTRCRRGAHPNAPRLPPSARSPRPVCAEDARPLRDARHRPLASAFARSTSRFASASPLRRSPRTRSSRGRLPRPRAARVVICSALSPALSRTLFVFSPDLLECVLDRAPRVSDSPPVVPLIPGRAPHNRRRPGGRTPRIETGKATSSDRVRHRSLSAILAPLRCVTATHGPRVCREFMERSGGCRPLRLPLGVAPQSRGGRRPGRSVRSRRLSVSVPALVQPRLSLVAQVRDLFLPASRELLCSCARESATIRPASAPAFSTRSVRLGFRTVRRGAGVDDDVRGLGPFAVGGELFGLARWAECASISAPLS